MATEIVIATRNPGKMKEIRLLLEDLEAKLLSLEDLSSPIAVAEEGATYEENAAKKALAAHRATGRIAIGEDSGLEVDALGGEPGIYSNRWGSGELTPPERNALILEALKGIPSLQRKARFRCVVAVCDQAGNISFCQGSCEGEISEEPRGREGFGYDPIFLLPERGKTMAELAPQLKNRISHRAKAFRQAVEVLRPLIKRD